MNKIKTILEERNIDAILLTDYFNKRYITGFTGTTGIALAQKSELIFYTDARYTIQAKEQTAPNGFRVVDAAKNTLLLASEDAKRLNVKVLGLDEENVTLSMFEVIKRLFPNTEFVNISKDLKALRRYKSKEEIEYLTRAARISDIAFTEVQKIIKPGITEKEIAAYIEYIQRINGADDKSFETIVASGYRSAMPHGVASDKKVQENEFITMDFGCYYKGYASDMTRTVYLGNSIPEKEKEIYNRVLEGNKLGITLVKKGAKGKDIDGAVRKYLEENGGYHKYFTHSLGHSFGLEVHEEPYLSTLSEDVLDVDQLVTIEPGIYIEGFGGVRIEDDILITEEGPVQLNQSDKELILIKVEK